MSRPTKVAPKRAEPHFELAPLTGLDPALIVPKDGDDRLAAFMLALALVFNDLKGIALFGQWMLPSRPKEPEISQHCGQWRGMDLQLHRLAVSLIRELLTLIEAFKGEATGKRVEALLSSAAPRTRRDWRDLVAVATGSGDESDRRFAKVVEQVRHNVAFHYYQPRRLVAGFRTFFFEAPPSASNEHAYCSFGRNMEETRFYYADAAIEGALKSIQGPDFLGSFDRVRKATNNALAHLLEEYSRRARRTSRRSE
jgi:hypothetical protein